VVTIPHANDLLSVRIRAIVEDPSLAFSESEVHEVMDLVSHREFEVALHNLAWIIHDEGKTPSAESMRNVVELLLEFVEPGDWPPTISCLLEPPL